MALTLLPYFANLVSKVESFELFQRSLESSDSTTTTFTTANRRCTTSHGTPSASHSNQQGRSHSHDNNSSNQGQTHFGQGRRPPRCQICRMRAIMLIAATNGILGLIPLLILPKSSTHLVLFLDPRLLTGFWTPELWPI